MRQIYTKNQRSLLLFLLTKVMLLCFQPLAATHLMGGDLTYEWQGGNTYKLKLAMYRDCAGIAINPSYLIYVNSVSCGYSTTLVANLEPGYPIEVTAVCLSQIGNTTCHTGGTLQGVEEYVYSVLITLPYQCNDWTFGTDDCCRNNNISTGPAGDEFYLEATLNNLDFPGNNSPTFITKPVPFLGVNQPQNYSHATVEPDGDVLVYSLVNPLQDIITPVNFLAPYNANYPVSTVSGTFPINATNGMMSFTPNQIQNGVCAVLVQEYRNGQLIGSVRRDIQMVIVNAPNGSVFFGPITNLAGATMNPGQTHVMTGCVGVPIEFDYTATDPNGSTPLIFSNNTTTIANSNLGISGASTRTMHFSWTPTASAIGYNSFITIANDNACPIPSIADVNIIIYVTGADAYANDPSLCVGQSTQLEAFVYGNTSGTYTWTGPGGFSSNSTAPTVSPGTLPATYQLTYNVGLCSSTDIVTISSKGSIAAAPANANVCPNQTVQLYANANLPGSASQCELVPGASCSGATTNFTAGTGTASAAYPFAGVWEDGRTQMLFTASELDALGMSAGYITALAFNVATKASTLPYGNFSIRLGCTSANSLSGYIPNLNIVYSGTYSTIAGWNTFNFIHPYTWDGSSNLIVEVCFDNNTWTNTDLVSSTNQAFNAVYYNYLDGEVGCNLTTGFDATLRPNIRFSRCGAGAPSYTWAPAMGLSATNIANPTATISGTQQYEVTASLNGCTLKDTVVVNTQNLLAVVPSQTSICENSATPVSFNTTVLLAPTTIIPSCGTNAYTCVGTPYNTVVGSLGVATAAYPFGGYFEDGRTQMLFLASELSAAGITPGNLNSLSFQVTDNWSYEPYSNFNIRLGCTALNSLAAYQGGLTTVYSTNYTLNSTGWISFPFSQPYGWDGSSNLVVEICFDNSTWSDDDYVSVYNTGFNSVLTYSDDGETGCTMTSSVSTTFRPVVRFNSCDLSSPITYSWSPPTGLSATDIPNPTALPLTSTTYTLTISNGTCSSSTTANLDVLVCAPLPIEDLSLTATLHESFPQFVTVNWTKVNETEVQSYVVERKYLNEADFYPIGNTSAFGKNSADYEWNDTQLNLFTTDKTIYYRIRQISVNGEEAISDAVEVKLGQYKDELSLSLHPNPATKELNVSVQNYDLNLEDFQVRIFDIAAREVSLPAFRYFDRNLILDVSNLPAGSYFIAVANPNGMKTYKKFIKSE